MNHFKTNTRGSTLLTVLITLLVLSAMAFALQRIGVLQSIVLGDRGDLSLSLTQNGFDALDGDTFDALDEAQGFFEQALTEYPENLDAKVGRAQVRIRRAEHFSELLSQLLGAEREAMRLYTESLLEKAFLELGPLSQQAQSSHRAMSALADYYRLRGDTALMEQSLKRASLSLANDAEIPFIRGADAFSSGKRDQETLDRLQRAVTLKPSHIRARYYLSRLFLSRGQSTAAKLQIDAIRAASPKHVGAMEDKQTFEFESLDQEPSAPPKSEDPSPKKKKSVDAMLRRALRLQEAGRTRKAFDLFAEVTELDEHNLEGFVGLGYCFLDMDRNNQAIASFEEAIRIAPQFADAHFGLAESFRLNNRKRDAMKHYQTYLKVLPTGQHAGTAKRQLEALQGKP